MFARFSIWMFGLTVLMAAIAPPAHAETKRVALVIGNSAYKHASELRNPRNDAQDVADALERLGFAVTSGFDLDHAGIRRSISRFAVELEHATVAVFYYAGHGIQIGGANFLVPTDSKLENHYSPDFELIRIDTVQKLMENKPRTSIIFLDSCRDNPLARNLARAMGTRSAGIQPGLSAAEAGIGTLISYSTQPGAVAQDGTGRNSPYAEALVRQLVRPGVAITDMLLDVRRNVMLATRDRQIPWEHSALRDRFYFSPPKPVVVAPPPAAKPEEVQATLARQLNRELRRVGCDPRASDASWKEGSQTALQRFAEITKLALYTDVPTKAALDAVASHKFIVCPRIPVAKPLPPETRIDKPVAVAPPPTISSPPPIVDPAALAPVTPLTRKESAPEPVAAVPAPKSLPKTAIPPASATPPAAVVAPVVFPPPVAAIPPAAVALPGPAVPPAEVSPPAAAKPPKNAPRAVPRAAAVKSPPPPPTAAVQPAPFATSIQRENKCRLETQTECMARLGVPTGVPSSVCPVASRKEICPGSRPAATRPSPARTVERETKGAGSGKKCRRETVDECYRRNWSFGNQAQSICPSERVVCQ